MELEEMKALWGEMTADMEKQKTLTSTLIIKMTQVNYRNKINRVQIPEVVGCFGGLAFATYIVINFTQLNTWYLVACGIVSVLTLCVMPYLSIRALNKLKRVNIAGNNYKQSLQQYSTNRLRFVLAQKINLILGALLVVTILPTMVAVMDGKDVFKTNFLWYYYVVCFPIFYGVAKWVFRYYLKAIGEAENILKELEA